MFTTKKILAIVLFTGLTLTLFSFDYPLPEGWFKAGDKPISYDMGTDKGAGHDGKNAATIKSVDKTIDGFGTLMQNCSPEKYLGKRVRMSGYIKTKDVSDWAGFWFRVDTKDGEKNMPFDNMHDGKKDRSLKGTTEWKKYDLVLDVPQSTTNLAYGALLAGTGQIWFDNLKFEIVDKTVPTTGMDNDQKNNFKEPTNLNFEK